MGLFKRLPKPDPKKEQELLEEIERHGGLEKKDVLAMILAALVTIMPLILILFLLIAVAALMFIG